MVGTADPYYNRKPVPDELIKDVGVTGLAPHEEFLNRERKYSVTGTDVRRFSSSQKGGLEPLGDPYYTRRRLSKAEIADVGQTGLTPEEEYRNRERKYSATGVDVRKFSTSRNGFLEPQDDPYYARKKMSKAEITSVGDTGMTPAQQFEVRERKQSLFQLSGDPFDLVAGRHRQSVSGVASGASDAATRRRSSAVAPDIIPTTASHSGYHGERLAPIESRPEIPPETFANISFGNNGESSGSSFDREPAAHDGGAEGGHTRYYDAATKGHNHLAHAGDPDSVAPGEVR